MKYFMTIAGGVIATAAWASIAQAADVAPPCDSSTVGVRCVESSDQIGPWSLQEVVPPVGSQNSLIMSTTSYQPLPGIFGREQEATLLLTCVENTTRFEVTFGENFMSDVGDYGALIYKLDDEPPVALNAVASADNFSLGLYSGAQAIPLIVSMFGNQRLFVTATSFTGRTLTASFSIDGLEDAVEPLRDLCNW
jgi:type VI secretion system protein VasI